MRETSGEWGNAPLAAYQEDVAVAHLHFSMEFSEDFFPPPFPPRIYS